MSKESNYIKLTNILSILLDVSREEINDDMSPENTNSWDSYNGLMMVSELEEKFDVSFTMEEVVSVRNVKDIKFYLRKHGIEI